ncbi:MAG: hypothetical protein KA239_06925 [Bacteroidia bacterium]|nr:hypothetical protein [Bacteroidia bacterium]
MVEDQLQRSNTTKVVLPCFLSISTFVKMLGESIPQRFKPNLGILIVTRIMKSLFLMIAFCITFLSVNAQVVSDLKPDAGGKMGEFTEWKKADVDFGDNTNAVIEYRIALDSKRALACNYVVEVKNTSDMKLQIRLKSNYYDKLVKGYFGDEVKGTAKPGKTVVGKFIGQGCKNNKGEDFEGYALCINCGLTVSIFVSK